MSLGYSDPIMKDVVDRASKVADSQASLLINGETGVGKKYLGKAIHESRPFGGHFVVVNCSQIEILNRSNGDQSNQSSEPVKDNDFFERAAGGTLFLSEIGDLSKAAQAYLLSRLKEDENRRETGSHISGRRMKVISSTTHDIQDRVRRGDFRADLFFYLAATTITLPSLTQREDFDWLLDRLLKQRSIAYPHTYSLSISARMDLKHREWPGNIRELINVFDIALAVCDGHVIDLNHLPPPTLSLTPDVNRARSETELSADLENALEICGWNISRAARRLGVNRSTIHRRIQRMGLTRPD